MNLFKYKTKMLYCHDITFQLMLVSKGDTIYFDPSQPFND